jgi:GNAT superfamily N-acetyltransferase
MEKVLIKQVEPKVAKKICRHITAKLPEWFGIPEANERYAKGCLDRISFAAVLDEDYIGLIVIEVPFQNNANIYWLGVDSAFHHLGIGKQLLKAAENYCLSTGVHSLTVETLSTKHADEYYLKTYKFYEKNEFNPLFELQPYGPDHVMCYLEKRLLNFHPLREVEATIRKMKAEDIPEIVEAFEKIGWDKPPALFKKYLNDQRKSERFVWVAYNENQFAGYVTLCLHSSYLPFREKNVPEIMDLNVLPHYRKKGIGSQLLDIAESQAAMHNNQVGIGVGLSHDYGSAQRLYVMRGYIPDGNGITYQYQNVIPYQNYLVDDDLILWFTKALQKKSG